MVSINNIDCGSQDSAPKKKRKVVFDAIIGVAIGLATCISLNAIRGYFSLTTTKSILPEAIKKTIDKDLGISIISGFFWLSDAIHHNRKIDELAKQKAESYTQHLKQEKAAQSAVPSGQSR